jgi:hypothetical protein
MCTPREQRIGPRQFNNQLRRAPLSVIKQYVEQQSAPE